MPSTLLQLTPRMNSDDSEMDITSKAHVEVAQKHFDAIHSLLQQIHKNVVVLHERLQNVAVAVRFLCGLPLLLAFCCGLYVKHFCSLTFPVEGGTQSCSNAVSASERKA